MARFVQNEATETTSSSSTTNQVGETEVAGNTTNLCLRRFPATFFY